MQGQSRSEKCICVQDGDLPQPQPSTSGAAPYLSLGGAGGSGGLNDDPRHDPHAGLMASLGATLIPEQHQFSRGLPRVARILTPTCSQGF